MGRGRVVLGVLAALLLVLGLGVALVLPAVAEGIIADRLEQELAGRFGTPVEVTVDVAGPGPLLRGEVASVAVRVTGHRTTVDGVAVDLEAIAVDLAGLKVDRQRALGGDLERIEVASGSVGATLGVDGARALVSRAVEAAGTDVRVTDVELLEARVRIRLEVPGAGTAVAEGRLAIDGATIRFADVVVDASDAATLEAATSLLAELRVDLPTLPLELAFDIVDVDVDGVRLRGGVPQVIDLA